MDRRGNQSGGGVGGPIGGSRHHAELATPRPYQKRGGQTDDRPGFLQRAQNLSRGISVKRQRPNIRLLQETLPALQARRIDADRDHLELRASQLRLQFVQGRHFLPARNAPSGPQIEKDGLAFEIGDAQSFALRSLEVHVWKRGRGRREIERGEIAARKRGDLLDEACRPRTIGGRRCFLASAPADLV